MMTIDERRRLCIHEAAHAVILSIGGALVRKVAIEGERGTCVTDGLFVRPEFFWWSAEHHCYYADSKRFNAHLRQLRKTASTEARRKIRAHVCGLLAGPISEAICANEDSWYWVADYDYDDEGAQHHDIPRAMGLSGLLPRTGEFEHARKITEVTLRQPAVWVQVLALADALEVKGAVDDDLSDLLPARLHRWPPSPPVTSIKQLAA